MGQSKSRSSDGFNFAHTSFMLTEPKSWRKVTVGIIAAFTIVIVLLIVLLICLLVTRPWENGGAQRDQGSVSTQQPSVSGCFPEYSTIRTSHGKKRIDQLQIGDMILDMDEHGKPGYTEVYAWFRKSSQTAVFLELTTDDNRKVVLSQNHLIMRYSLKNSFSIIKEKVLAKEITVGDFVFGGRDSWNITKVVLIKPVVSQGLYAPATLSGTLFVDDIFVSCYTDYWINGLVGHEFIHDFAMLPLRMIYKLVGDNEFVLHPVKNENLWFVEAWKMVNFVLSKFLS